ncbi:hypothetical protein CO701_06755 [Citrobacter werkmanii]|nr:hypothetical protein CO701_06755 [Citrobacter werkmanii]TKU61408.1 hypothetical protein FDW98_12025 [Citrobacter sp. wls711]
MWSEPALVRYRSRQKRSSQPTGLRGKNSYPYAIILMRTDARVHQKELPVRRITALKKAPQGLLITMNAD